MPWTNEHIQWLHDTGGVLTLECGREAKVFRFNHDVNDQRKMTAWAKHFRNHYCNDTQIDLLKAPGQTRADYLLSMKFPSATIAPGPSIRAGDFAEILVADYLTYLHNYFVPRTRYDRKGVPNESTKGSDVLAFKQVERDPNNDELLVYEVKAKLSAGPKSMLQEAIDHSAKDHLRLAESLNGIKQRMIDRNDFTGIGTINRFQDSVNRPYKLKFGAAAICSDSAYDAAVLSGASTTKHPYAQELELLAIQGNELMTLAHTLFERAANEV
ncbi:Hachiman antiphage defense system protein HamA [Providencia sp. PROV069]|uniref:Hachiman antiphage defense system protein HamA n=1 Tax=Providencia sp. PROV069 TaxID=2949795 RepID=UPI00234B831A|nr:Hachiman antiphage defense system protein HamA [Providencia sp. PROV069]